MTGFLDEDEAIFGTKVASFLLLITALLVFLKAPSFFSVVFFSAAVFVSIVSMAFAASERTALARDLVLHDDTI